MFILEARYDGRASFGGKAKVDEIKRDTYLDTPPYRLVKAGSKVLYSYSTAVCVIEDGKAIVFKLYSDTTTRHIKEFLKQNGFKAESGKQILNDYQEA